MINYFIPLLEFTGSSMASISILSSSSKISVIPCSSLLGPCFCKLKTVLFWSDLYKIDSIYFDQNGIKTILAIIQIWFDWSLPANIRLGHSTWNILSRLWLILVFIFPHYGYNREMSGFIFYVLDRRGSNSFEVKGYKSVRCFNQQ